MAGELIALARPHAKVRRDGYRETAVSQPQVTVLFDPILGKGRLHDGRRVDIDLALRVAQLTD